MDIDEIIMCGMFLTILGLSHITNRTSKSHQRTSEKKTSLEPVCDADYIFTLVDIGTFGSQSDGGVFKESTFGRALESGAISLPEDSSLPNTNTQNSKPFTEGVFVRNCIIEAVKAFGNSLTLEQAANILLSSKTVTTRIAGINDSIGDKLQDLLKSCKYFSLCLDESTDIRHMSQLSIFTRIVQDDYSCVEELLDFVILRDITTGLDIFLAVEEILQKFNIDFSKCSSITTDGARAMTDLKIGFAGQLKQRNLNIPIIHYTIIHQEALAGKVVKLSTAMETITKIINEIKGGHKFLTHRKFKLFLDEHKAVYTDVPLHCPVRWLSAAKCLQVFFAIRKEILLFLKEMNKSKFHEYLSLLEDVTFLTELAFITDISNQLRLLNLKLQKTDQNISQLVSHVNSFRRKLQALKCHLNSNIFHFFPSCQIILEEHGSICNFKEYTHFIDSLIDEFDTRFTCFEKLKTELILFENPLTAPIEEQHLDLQDELFDLQNDISLKTVQETGVDFYKMLKESSYPKLRDFGLRIHSMFGSTYLCEISFSKMKLIKNERRSSLSDDTLPRLMRVATSNIQIDVSALTNKGFRKLDRI
ncbi:PREDICTED: general transcription factor II-I repeat domain-containing protein 2B-like [Trachymyrmex cornetzi]|uniref:general transcription factor II-I repeat domain-containing protein 2B-like n=1 Tax=Trachymyrmex cornetzi TaxID=471704 RepID=UPI00084EF081|nr:PREDICTED: general transcription factor II-I repeat domain-containing protein 2B-like [Trachymyrmex cornetzi]